MSYYTIEEPNEDPIFYNTKTDEEISMYWVLYSPIQRNKFKRVLRQLRETWYSVYNNINFLRINGGCDIMTSNELMMKIHRMFIIEHKHKIEYYKEENMRLRKQKGYLKKKINKLRNNKSKI